MIAEEAVMLPELRLDGQGALRSGSANRANMSTSGVKARQNDNIHISYSTCELVDPLVEPEGDGPTTW